MRSAKANFARYLQLIVKRVFDIAASTIGLVLFSPLLLPASLAIKLESQGPIFSVKHVYCHNNQHVRVLRFRTRSHGDVTIGGRFLIRTGLDQLPMLINVLRGEMSIVGPRPHPIALNAMFQQRIAPFSRRHNVKPGLTGWAQVNGLRGETDTIEKMQRRIDYDLYYIDNWSFMLDLKIIVLTLFSKSAYTNAA